ncbi:MAG: hypothetical protein KDK66_04705 [Deltaproteobacteria bacterium]|nr:hypothetical protein [Deltaproteobacteria bacterium]
MKKSLFLLALIFLASCGGTEAEDSSLSLNELEDGMVEAKSLYLEDGNYYLEIDFKFYSRSDGNILTQGKANFRKPFSQPLHLLTSSNDRSCSITTGTPGIQTDSYSASNNIEGGLLNLEGEEIIPDGSQYNLDNVFVSSGQWIKFYFDQSMMDLSGISSGGSISDTSLEPVSGGALLVEGSEEVLIIPSIDLDLWLAEKSDLTLKGEVLTNSVDLRELPNIRWTPMENLYESSENHLVFTRQKVIVTAKNALGHSLGRLTCSLYSTESSLNSVLGEESLKVEDILAEIEKEGEEVSSISFTIEKYYLLGELLPENGGLSAKVMHSQSFNLSAY